MSYRLEFSFSSTLRWFYNRGRRHAELFEPGHWARSLLCEAGARLVTACRYASSYPATSRRSARLYKKNAALFAAFFCYL